MTEEKILKLAICLSLQTIIGYILWVVNHE